MWTIFGLGNPGREYNGTRHNLGYEVLDELADRFDISFTGGGRHYVSGPGKVVETQVELVKPTRYMNRSGLAWRECSEKESFKAGQTLVIYDDLHIPFGLLRIRKSGSAGGHNGMKSILDAAGHNRIPRIRLGIGGEDRDWVDHVLSPFTSAESKIIDRLIQLAADAVQVTIQDGLETAMNRFNGSSA